MSYIQVPHEVTMGFTKPPLYKGSTKLDRPHKDSCAQVLYKAHFLQVFHTALILQGFDEVPSIYCMKRPSLLRKVILANLIPIREWKFTKKHFGWKLHEIPNSAQESHLYHPPTLHG